MNNATPLALTIPQTRCHLGCVRRQRSSRGNTGSSAAPGHLWPSLSASGEGSMKTGRVVVLWAIFALPLFLFVLSGLLPPLFKDTSSRVRDLNLVTYEGHFLRQSSARAYDCRFLPCPSMKPFRFKKEDGAILEINCEPYPAINNCLYSDHNYGFGTLKEDIFDKKSTIKVSEIKNYNERGSYYTIFSLNVEGRNIFSPSARLRHIDGTFVLTKKPPSSRVMYIEIVLFLFLVAGGAFLLLWVLSKSVEFFTKIGRKTAMH